MNLLLSTGWGIVGICWMIKGITQQNDMYYLIAAVFILISVVQEKEDENG